ncbi:MAG: hypothetical protein IPO78_14250 [Saprospiraceae bacterium]|nr:hypothetical protein [Saprospiraceae bacterium]
MKHILFLLTLMFVMSSCEKELAKWEFVNNFIINERGEYTSTGINIHKTITKNDIVSKLKLKSSAEIRDIKIKDAIVTIDLLQDFPQADSIKLELYCDAIPLIPTHKKTLAIKKGVTSKDFSKEKIKLGPISLETISFVNQALNNLVLKGGSIKFNLIGRTIPSGAILTGFSTVYVNMDVVYWECISKPEYFIFDVRHKGPCN